MSGRATTKTTARERIAAQRAAEARGQRRRRMLLAGGAVALVLVVIVALVVANAAGVGTGTNGGTTAATDSGTASTRVVDAVTSVPATTLDKVGAGTSQTAPKGIQAPALSADGKPKVLYVGAEYCPFCAAERWPVVVALSRFGTWSHLGATASAGNDVYPNTPTLSFHGATYTSDYLSFTGVETTTNKVVNGQYAPLDKLTAADQQVFDTYNQPPYTDSAGGIPFLDIAGRYVSSGASYSPEVLAGESRAQIAAALADPTDPVAEAIDGSANVLSAALCEATNGQPANVCGSPGVKAAATVLAKAQQQ